MDTNEEEVKKSFWKPFLKTVSIFVIFLICFSCFMFLVVYKGQKDKDNKNAWETSPCGTKIYEEYHLLGSVDRVFPSTKTLESFADDGKRVWQYKLFFPNSEKPAPPEYKWIIVMERTPEACEQWIEKTGIDLRNK